MTTSDWISLLNAIVTILAVVVALYFGVDANRKSQRDALSKANLVAARFSVALKSAVASSEGFSCQLLFPDLTIQPGDTQGIRRAQDKAINEALRIITVTIFEEDLDTLAALTPLPNHCAHRIARASGLLVDVKRQIEEVSPNGGLNGGWFRYETKKREQLLARWGRSISEASELLRAAQGICEKAMTSGAPHPSGEELFGP